LQRWTLGGPARLHQLCISRDLHCIEPAKLHRAKQLHRHQTGLHRPKYKRQAVRLHQNYVKIIVEFYIVNTNIAKIYIHVVFRRRRKNPAAAVIFDRRRRLRQDPPPP
jgi:hypothetical protein